LFPAFQVGLNDGESKVNPYNAIK